MKKLNDTIKIILSLSIILLLLSNCSKNDLANRSYNLPDFEQISNNTFADVHISQSNTQSVEVFAPEVVLNNLIFDVKNNKLHIDYKRNICLFHMFVDIYINIPTFSGYYLNGSGNMEIVNRFDSCPSMNLRINGSGNIKGNMNVNNYTDIEINGSGNIKSHLNVNNYTDIDINGSGNLDLSGNSYSQRINISGSGNVNALSFMTRIADISVSGSGNCKIYADSLLNVFINGSGNIRYTGNPRVTSNLIGSGNIKQM